MSAMLDKATEAVSNAAGGDIPSLADCRWLARAALEAIRDADSIVLNAMHESGWTDYDVFEKDKAWRAGVDAILSQK
jgi:hypothetical protein